jgi:hypothetical protein
MQHYLLFATELYALPILRPLAHAIEARGGKAAWSVTPAIAPYLTDSEHRLVAVDAVRQFAPRAVFSASNWVPHFFPGVKVQVFHGFNVEKRSAERGHFRIRNLFDLYCTQGPATTEPFRKLAAEHGHFAVAETGWPKLDPLYAPDDGVAATLRPNDGRPVCMYAATFTESLSSARDLYEPIAAQVAKGDRYWLLTLHPKTDPALVARYRQLTGPNARFLEAVDLVPMMRAADVLVSDTSSVVSEFAVQGRPVITLRNRAPKPHMLDFADPQQLEQQLQTAFAPPPELLAALRDYATYIHPWRDGRSSERVLDATEALCRGEFGVLAKKPSNLWRKVQGRLRYRRFMKSESAT